MRYIQKSIEPPIDFQKWLKDNRIEIEKCYSRYNANSNNIKSDIAWNLLSGEDKEILRKTLLKEQGYLCAYCGSKIEDNENLGNHRVRLDHIIPKSIAIEGTFNYYNIVTACTGGEYTWHTIQPNETIESISQKYGTDANTLERFNPNVNFTTGDIIDVQIAVSIRIAHCDVKKSDKQHVIKPTDVNCQSKFSYTYDGQIEGIDKDAIDTIEVLGLNDNIFVIAKRRRILHGVDSFVKIFFRLNSELLSQALILKKQNLYQNMLNLPEMVFVEEFFLNTFPKSNK